MEPDKQPLSPSGADQRLATPGVLDAQRYADEFSDVESASITGRSEYSTDLPQVSAITCTLMECPLILGLFVPGYSTSGMGTL